MEDINLRTSSLAKVMPWRNVEKRNAYNKKYREEHRDALLEANNIKFECGCGGRYTKIHTRRHERTQRHIEWLINEPIERRRILEEKTNPDIAQMILEFVG